MNWGTLQVVVLSLVAVSLLGLGTCLIRGSWRWLVTTLAISAIFVVVLAAAAAPKVFNDSGPVRLALFG